MYESDPTLFAGYDRQLSLVAEAFASNKSAVMGSPIAGDAYSLLILQKPLSRGTITVDPSNPIDGDPLVDYGTLTNPLDMNVMISMMEFTRRWYRTEAMQSLAPAENSPGASVVDYKDLENYVRDHAENTIGHQSGTTAMMPLELGGVVNPDLLVYGTEGLSVVDASIIPLIPSTNLCATVYAIAEKVRSTSRHSYLRIPSLMILLVCRLQTLSRGGTAPEEFELADSDESQHNIIGREVLTASLIFCGRILLFVLILDESVYHSTETTDKSKANTLPRMICSRY